ncbi:MAG: class I SAM-dependent methyltransferase [Defluviitaleaceae bacterium]|nr:class I SAM-dependent methyltransferase [Defluviitaleaceae bacterium]
MFLEVNIIFKEYGKLSTILYEHTKPIGRSVDGDIEYYSEMLKSISGSVLEAGVGTGRMLIPLIKRGLKVDGVDLSAEMLSQCKVNLEKHECKAKLYQQDLTKMSLPTKYDAIIMPTGSFCLLPKSIIGDVLASFYNYLEVGGKAIIDLQLPTDFKKGEVESYSCSLDDDGVGILFTSISQDIDWIKQKVSYIHRYELLKNGDVQQKEISNFVLYWYGITEFEMLLKSAGFKDVSHVVGYGNENLPYLVTFTAIKK